VGDNVVELAGDASPLVGHGRPGGRGLVVFQVFGALFKLGDSHESLTEQAS
jgi:hypothetical protein